MKIDFDTSNAAEVAAVLALARSLGGEKLTAYSRTDTIAPVRFFPLGGTSVDDAPDAAPPYITTPEHAADVAARAMPVGVQSIEVSRDINPLHFGTADAEGAYVESVDADTPATDSKGREWDERIHSSSRATNADGTWRYKRGVDKALVATVEAEALAPYAAEQVAQAIADAQGEDADEGTRQVLGNVPPPPPTQAAPPAAPAPTESAEAAATIVADVPPPPHQHPGVALTQYPDDEQLPTTMTAQAPGLTFADLMKRIGAAKRDGSLTDAQVAEYCGALGIGGLAELASRPDLVPAFGELVA